MQQAARFLLQAQFSASDAEIASVRSTGYGPWLRLQMDATSQSSWEWLNNQGFGNQANINNFFDQSYPFDYAIWNQLIASRDAVRKRCALALSEFFVVSATGVEMDWRAHGMAAWWDMLCGHAFGNFRTLLQDVCVNPAMGVYLNARGSRKEDASGRLPDENFAREILQLMSIGLVQLNLDGTPKLDGLGNKIDTYTQTEISELARVFTGYDHDRSLGYITVNGRTVIHIDSARLPMPCNTSTHSTLSATFLGTTVPGGATPATALSMTVDAIFRHPNVGPFLGKQMIQRLVTSNPSPAYVARVAGAFNNNGAGVRGDLKAVFSAILLDEEARSATGLTQPTFGKVREPMIRFVQWARTFGVTSASGGWRLPATTETATSLGQSPLRSPSVFNFFRPGYVPPSTALTASKSPAPEMQIVNETTVTGYVNYMHGVIRTGLNSGDIKASYAAELALVADAAALVARLNLLLCADQLSAGTVSVIVGALNATPVTTASTETAKLDRVAAAVLMVMSCPEYLVQK